MKIKSYAIKNSKPDRFAIDGDFALFKSILDDMNAYGGELIPSENWGLDIGGHNGGDYFYGNKIIKFSSLEELYNERYSTMKKMMDPWVGCIGMQNITNESIKDYLPFFAAMDNLKLSNQILDNNGQITESCQHLLNTDLGSIIDVNFIDTFTKHIDKGYFLEVGGGYGRLAETFFNLYGKEQIKYVLVDSVPASLLYAYKYMKTHFTNINVGFYYLNDPFDLDIFDCYIMPSWKFEELNTYKYDVCCNIQSMQEMNQLHIDYYLNLFDKLLKEDGIIYLSNEKDYVFKGDWNYPKRWERALKTRTPRSWTRNSPTEVFTLSKNKNYNFSLISEFYYTLQLSEYDLKNDLLAQVKTAPPVQSAPEQKVNIFSKINRLIRKI